MPTKQEWDKILGNQKQAWDEKNKDKKCTNCGLSVLVGGQVISQNGYDMFHRTTEGCLNAALHEITDLIERVSNLERILNV